MTGTATKDDSALCHLVADWDERKIPDRETSRIDEEY
jgi:hypothetical protein